MLPEAGEAAKSFDTGNLNAAWILWVVITFFRWFTNSEYVVQSSLFLFVMR
jgi:hypothetical protein